MPYIQDELKHDEWMMLISCIMLNLTNIRQVRTVIWDFFERFPSANDVQQEHLTEIAIMLKPLGFYNRRAQSIIKFSKAYRECDYKKISDLPGIGKYASDSHEIFINKNFKVKPTDKKLLRYLEEVGK
jgi:methyl-CpG-binding domain protein 4